MKAFAGKRCSICRESIPTGTDVHYDGETKTVQHWECFEKEQPPTEEQFQLADELGFIEFDPELPADGLLWRMRPADRGADGGMSGWKRLAGPIESDNGIALDELIKFCDENAMYIELKSPGFKKRTWACILGAAVDPVSGNTLAEACCRAIIEAAKAVTSEEKRRP